MKTLQVCPPHLSDAATLPWEIQNVIFQHYFTDSVNFWQSFKKITMWTRFWWYSVNMQSCGDADRLIWHESTDRLLSRSNACLQPAVGVYDIQAVKSLRSVRAWRWWYTGPVVVGNVGDKCQQLSPACIWNTTAGGLHVRLLSVRSC